MKNGKFVRVEYFIAQRNDPPKLVKGYAFETPDWSEFHACIRFDACEVWSNKRWIFDHYESGLALRQAGEPKYKDEAPAMLKRFLDGKGREKVLTAINKYK